MIHRPDDWWVAVVAVVYSLVTSGQFLSQILAESFVRTAGRRQSRGGDLRSWILLPTDPGTLCWSFLLGGGAVVRRRLLTAGGDRGRAFGRLSASPLPGPHGPGPGRE
ncbi:hypothetical protein QP028_05135 [Corynebacterium suedekumii]|nr:hypothetical protein QP028_05135 [Corynebacterium suedekumii]